MNVKTLLPLSVPVMLAFGCGSDATPNPDPVDTLMPAPIGGNHALVDFPSGYADGALFTTVDKPDKKQVRRIFANDVALASPAGNLARGSKVVMEVWSAQLDTNGDPMMDDRGRFIADELAVVALMEKQEGFGKYTEETKNGEWEYAFFTPAGEDMASELDCYGCHKDNAGPSKDFVFTLEQLEAWQTQPAPIGGNLDILNFPEGYAGYRLATTVDKETNKQVRKIYANDTAIRSASTGTLDRGSIVVMEIYAAQLDMDENPVVGMDGRYIEDTLNIVAVMEKQQGFGNYTSDTRNGEWEYAFFTPSGAPMASTADCYGCHLENAATSDYVFSLDDIAQLQ